MLLSGANLSGSTSLSNANKNFVSNGFVVITAAIGGIILANTQAAPYVAGLLFIAIIDQWKFGATPKNIAAPGNQNLQDLSVSGYNSGLIQSIISGSGSSLPPGALSLPSGSSGLPELTVP